MRKESPVPRSTATAQFAASPNLVAQAVRIEAEIDIMEWLDGVRSVQATEEAIGLGSYGKTLTVLTCPSVVDDTSYDEGEDEETLIESWTPRFRH